MENNDYADLIRQIKVTRGDDPELSRRITELISLNELVATLNTASDLDSVLDLVLLTIMGEYPCRIGAVFIWQDERWTLGGCKGISADKLELTWLPDAGGWEDLTRVISRDSSEPGVFSGFFDRTRFAHLFPIRSERQFVGLIALGASALEESSQTKLALIATFADFAGLVIGNHLYRLGLEKLNRTLRRRVFQLNTLYEITGSFARCQNNDMVFQVLSKNLMGVFLISRCVVLEDGKPLQISFCKGVKVDRVREFLPDMTLRPDAEDAWADGVKRRDDITSPSWKALMSACRLSYAKIIEGESVRYGLLLLGNRLDGRELSAEDMDFLESLIQQAAVALDNVALHLEALEKKRLERELQLAREIQQKLLPKTIPLIPGYDLSVEMRPYQMVGGDFYDFIPLDDGRLAICLADVSGKSLPASIIMTTTQASLRALTSFSNVDIVEIVRRLNAQIYHATQSNKYVTVFFAILDPIRHELTYVNAGHNRPRLLAPDRTMRQLDIGGMVVGLFPSPPYQRETVPFERGAQLLVFTDGLSEIMDAAGAELGEERLEQILLSHAEETSAETLKLSILREVLEFGGHRMIDDLTIMVVRRDR